MRKPVQALGEESGVLEGGTCLDLLEMVHLAIVVETKGG